ncbi:MAG: hypothetical protein PHW46_06520 [Candidatus Omnitrophica bacterium]|nr:hypothetical protein [Candidatus Omnitrophota bacterium]
MTKKTNPPVISEISLDGSNRLIITERYTSGLEKNPTVPRGRAKSVSAAAYEADVQKTYEKDILNRVVLDGQWSLTDEHDLKFHVLARNNPTGADEITFRGDIESVYGNALCFRIYSALGISGVKSSTIELKGVWQSDAFNRINFKITRSGGRYDTLIFQGAWEVSENNELVYSYERVQQKRGPKEIHRIIFSGKWDIEDKRLSYRLEGASDSYFSFTAQAESRGIRAYDEKIRYVVGIKFSSDEIYNEVVREVTIYGRWKVYTDLSVGFEITYSSHKTEVIKFSIGKTFMKDGNILVSLKDQKGRAMGVEVEFSKTFKNGANVFVSMAKEGNDFRCVGGVRMKF